MKIRFSILIVTTLLGVVTLFAQDTKLKVALFQGHGGAETCIWETAAALGMDRSIETDWVSTSGMTIENLSKYDVVVIPGGSGSRQYLNMGGKGREALRRFVENGGGVLGICAGAYLLTDTPDYVCLGMSGAEAYDIEHDNRGRGISKVSLDLEGDMLFPELMGRFFIYIMYYEGPVVRQSHKSFIGFRSLATMESDVHVEGDAPRNMTNNKPFLYESRYGSGKTMSVVGHPEATPGMQWMISRLVHHVSPKKVMPLLDKKFIDPDKFGMELLMTKERREKEQEAFKALLHGTPEEKIEMLAWLMKHNSWEGKRWLQGLIHDSDPRVRLAAIQYVGWAMHRMYLPDLHTALQREDHPEVRRALNVAIAAIE